MIPYLLHGLSNHLRTNYKSMALCKTAVTPVRQQWGYYSLALSHRNVIKKCIEGRTDLVITEHYFVWI